MADDGGVLGKLPNSRPGKRSAKRDSAARAAAKADAEGRPAAKPAHSPKGAQAAGAATPSVEEVPLPASEDPVGAAVRTAAGLAAASVKVTGAVTRELLRRLPRP
jgi:hypothetical protein